MGQDRVGTEESRDSSTQNADTNKAKRKGTNTLIVFEIEIGTSRNLQICRERLLTTFGPDAVVIEE